MDKATYFDVDLRPYNRYTVCIYKELPDGLLMTESIPYIVQQELNNPNDKEYFEELIRELMIDFSEPPYLLRVEIRLEQNGVIVLN